MLRINRKSINLKLVGFFALVLVAAGLSAAVLRFTPEVQPVGYVPQPLTSSFYLASGTEKIYIPSYDKTVLAGNLFSHPISASAVIDIKNQDWNAADLLDARTYTDRKVVTFDGTTGVELSWANLSSAQQDAVSLDAALGAQIIDYMRGDTANEVANGGTLRNRTSVLGPIVHSQLVLHNNNIYVGANDGLLHVFSATDGTEKWAYLPSMLLKETSLYADATNATLKYMVDGSIGIGSSTINGSAGKLLAGSLGAGGQGLFALDVTADPTSVSAAAGKVLWEVTPSDTGYANLGYTYSRPVVTKVHSSSGSVDAVIVGNGYANTGNGHASLLVIDASDGSLIKELDVQPTATDVFNGLSSPAVNDTDNDGVVDIVYAGDLEGTLWKFDLSDDSSSNWSSSALYATGQAITTAPAVSLHPHGGYMVNFATGRILNDTDDADSSTVFAAYGIWDGAPANNTSRVTQALTAAEYNIPGIIIDVRYATVNEPDWTDGGDLGWKTPLPAGERVTGDGIFIDGGRLYFTATNPVSGDNWLLELSSLTGGGADQPFLDLNGDAVVDDNDRIKSASGSLLMDNTGVPVGKFVVNGVVSSQPVLVKLTKLFATLYGYNPDVENGTPPNSGENQYTNTDVGIPPSTSVDAGLGVAYGHFDYDIHVEMGGKNGSVHEHEYDDKENKTYVDFLNSIGNDGDFRIPKLIDSTTQQFKILIANQDLSPGTRLTFGPQGGTNSIKDLPIIDYYRHYGAIDANGNLDFSKLPTFTRADVENLVVSFPVDAFYSKDWGTGVVRPGLIPTQTGCVKGSTFNPGLYNEWRNGALTFQIVDAGITDPNLFTYSYQPDVGTTDDPALQRTVNGVTAIHPEERGFVINQSMGTSIPEHFGEYTLFWHHKGSVEFCYDEAGWLIDPNSATAGSGTTSGGTTTTTTTTTDLVSTVNADGTAVTTEVTVTTTTNGTPSTSTEMITNSYGTDVDALKNQLLQAQSTLKNAQDTQATAQSTLQGIQSQLNEANSSLAKKQNDLAKEQKKVAELQTKLANETQKSKKIEIQKELDKKIDKVAKKQAEVDSIAVQITDLEAKLATAKTDLEVATKAVLDATVLISQIDAMIQYLIAQDQGTPPDSTPPTLTIGGAGVGSVGTGGGSTGRISWRQINL